MQRFRAAWTATRMRIVFAHSSHLINLATPAKTEEHRDHTGPHRRRTSVGVGAPAFHLIVAEIPPGSPR